MMCARTSSRRWIALAAASVGLALAILAVASGPASAELHHVTVTLAGGTQVTVTVDVPPGTPVSSVHIPGITLPIVSVTDDGPIPGTSGPPSVSVGQAPPPPPPQQTTSTSTSTSTSAPQPSGGSGSTQSSSAPAPARHGNGPQPTVQVRQPTTGTALHVPVYGPASTRSRRTAPPPVPAPVAALRLPNGLPTAANPSLSLALPGAAPLGVPDFFIDNFRIPPFLLPIYQAAGTEYQVPWQILAAINEIETNYGRDLSVSTAGAEGWMQFLPETWRQWGVDATGSGIKDPYNPADAIFAAARYLHAAGASRDLRGAIFAYNHATWYVDSVVLRAKLIGGLPPNLLGAISGLTQGLFPVHARATYADDVTEASLAQRWARSHKVSLANTPSVNHSGTNIYARQGSPVVAVGDGQIVAMGQSPRLGNYLRMRDAYGNTYTYGQLGSLASSYPVPKPQTETTTQVARDLSHPASHDAAPSAPATAGYQAPTATASATPAPAPAAPAPAPAAPAAPAPAIAPATGAPVPTRLLSGTIDNVQSLIAAGTSAPGTGTTGLFGTAGLPVTQSVGDYFTTTFGLSRSDLVLRPLRVGAKVIAGTILGRIGPSTPLQASHVLFEIRPPGKGAPLIDPKPVLDGWVLLQRTSIYRAKGKNPFLNSAPTIGQVLLESKEQLTLQVLRDRHIDIYSCGRRDIQAGQIDQRVLAALEFLSASGLQPTVSALRCGRGLPLPASPRTAATLPDIVPEHTAGDALTLSAIDSIPITGHQGPGTITDIAIKRLLTLQGTYKPHEIVSLHQYPSTDNTVGLPSYVDRVDVAFLPLYDSDPRIRAQIDSVLQPSQWIKLIGRLNQIGQPAVPTQPTSSAIPDLTRLAH